jgi:hypothetical protein
VQRHWGFDSGVFIRPRHFGNGVRNGHFDAEPGKFIVRHGKFYVRDVVRHGRFDCWDFDVAHGV